MTQIDLPKEISLMIDCCVAVGISFRVIVEYGPTMDVSLEVPEGAMESGWMKINTLKKLIQYAARLAR